MTAPLGKPGSRGRREAVRRYFRRAPDPMIRRRARQMLSGSATVAVFAAALLVVGQAIPAVLVFVVALVAALHGWTQLREYQRRFDRAEPKPRDADMDQTLREDLDAAAVRAMARLELTEDELELRSRDVDTTRLADQGSGPLTVFGPAKSSKGRSGTDRVWRFTSYDVMVVCPTGHHLAIYECVLEFASGLLKMEETHEYHYADVVAVLTRSIPISELSIAEVEVGRYTVSLSKGLAREMEIVVSSGDRSGIAVTIEATRGGEIRLQESKIDEVIRAVRQMLREKKGGVAPTPRT